MSLYGLRKKLSCVNRLNLRKVLFEKSLMLKIYLPLYCLLNSNTNCKPYSYIKTSTVDYALIHSNSFESNALFYHMKNNINPSDEMSILPHESHEIRYSLNKNAIAQLFQSTLPHQKFSIFAYHNPHQPTMWLHYKCTFVNVSERRFFVIITFPFTVKWIKPN